jgi:hypothetical protein
MPKRRDRCGGSRWRPSRSYKREIGGTERSGMNVAFACEDVDREHFGVSTVLLKASSCTFKKSKRRATPIGVD